MCTVAHNVREYNEVDMNSFWKDDVLKFNVVVEGETDIYKVTVKFSHVLENIQREVAANNNKFNRDIITKALVKSMSTSDVSIACNCPDFKYRFAYWASQQGYDAGTPEHREAAITNPNDNKGAACKHVLAVISDVSWIRNLGSVIVNYANYCKDNMENNYGRYIFPKIFGVSYNKAIADVEHEEHLDSDEALLNLSNALGKVRGRFKKKTSTSQQQAKS